MSGEGSLGGERVGKASSCRAGSRGCAAIMVVVKVVVAEVRGSVVRVRVVRWGDLGAEDMM